MYIENFDLKPVYAIFDIDKTVLPGYSIIDFASFLAQHGRFDTARWTEIEALILSYKNKDIDYNIFADAIVETYAKGISGQKVEDVLSLSTEFWDDRLATVFPFIHTLMNELAEVNATTIAISGSTLESLGPLLSFLGFNTIFTTKVRIEDGKYTSEIEINAASRNQKEEIVTSIMKEIPQGAITYGYGDSIADIAFLSRVMNPIVVGTHDPELVEAALEKGWEIERSHELQEV